MTPIFYQRIISNCKVKKHHLDLWISTSVLDSIFRLSGLTWVYTLDLSWPQWLDPQPCTQINSCFSLSPEVSIKEVEIYEFGKIYQRLQLASMSEQPAIACSFSKSGACSVYAHFLLKKMSEYTYLQKTFAKLWNRILSCSPRQKTIFDFKHLK